MALGAWLMMGACRNSDPIAEATDDFNRADASPLDGDWSLGGSSLFSLVSNAVVLGNTTNATWGRNTNQLSPGAQYVQVTNLVYAVEVCLRVNGSTSPQITGYSFGRHYFGAGASDWRWELRRNGTVVLNLNQTPSVSPGTGCTVRMEASPNGSDLDFTVYVNGSEAGTYTDTSPLTDTRYAGIYGQGRGASEKPGLDNFEAGRL